MDTSDTGDTGQVSQEDSGFEIISAASIAGETGGFSCSAVNQSSTIAVFVFLFLCLCFKGRSI